MAEPLAQALGTDLSPFRDTLTSKRRAEESAGGLVTQAAQARGELAGLERGMEAERGAQRQAALTGVAEEAERKRGMLTQPAAKAEIAGKLEQPFVPSKANAEELAGLFSLINVVGLALGAGGKRNAMAAMSAMNGMAEGYQRGRQDVYKREKDQFDTNLKQLKQRYDVLDKEFKEALDLIKTDKEAGLLAADQAFAKAGADFYRQYAEKFGLAATYELHKQTYDAAKRATEKAEAELRRAEQTNLAAQREARQAAEAEVRRQQEERRIGLQERRVGLLEERAAAAPAEKEAKPPPKEIIAQNQLRNNLIPKLETALPVLDRLQKEGKWTRMTALLAVDPRAAEAAFRNDKEALNLILTLAYFRSKEFETAGKALTKKEDQILAPIVRGDLRTYEGIKNAMTEGLKTLKAEQRGLEKTYPYIRNLNEAMREPEDFEADKERRYQEWKARQPK